MRRRGPRKRDPSRLSVRLLGCEFNFEGLGKDDGALAAQHLEAVEGLVQIAAMTTMASQKREHLLPWDALTFMEFQRSDPRLSPDRSLQIFGRFLDIYAADELTDRDLHLIQGVDGLRPDRLRYVKSGDWGDLVNDEPPPVRIGKGVRPSRVAGAYLSVEIDGARLGNPADFLTWFGMIKVAALAALQVELMLYVETGFRRLRRCDRKKCGCWFAAQAMGSDKSRFCAARCRAANAREKPTK